MIDVRMYDIIVKKRDGQVLTESEINFIIQKYTEGIIPDYQMSALLMAIYFKGMTNEESAALTKAMVNSGTTVDLSGIHGTKVDKHSTGGVGDTTTLILAPLVASIGVAVAKMSGRGLGHTGGTIDKLEAIDGFHVEISEEKFIELVNNNGLAVIGQSTNLAPADKLLYSLRDVTATVDSIPLIASSIMSKKIASGADAIVLDVKTGAGAFMKELDDARKLARTMVDIGNNVGRKTKAIISNMEQPLGNAIGNALEVKEAILTLKGEGPADLTELTLELGSHMAVLAKKAKTTEEARALLQANLLNGKAIQYFKSFIEAQGGNGDVVEDLTLLPTAKYTIPIYAENSGYVTKMVADELGKAAMMLGAGRATKETTIDLAVGLVLHKKLGDAVQKGQEICTVYANNTDTKQVEEIIRRNIDISPEKMETALVLEVIE